MHVMCAAALSLQCFTREVKALPGSEEGKKPTEEANKRMAEVLEQQKQPESTRKWKAIVTQVRHVRRLESRYASVDGMTMDTSIGSHNHE